MRQMHRMLVSTLLAMAFVAHAEDARIESEATSLEAPPSVEAPRVPSEYAFDRPELLADQLVWGVVHGARLLALACAKTGHGAAAEAWVNWREREAVPMATMNERLGLHYFQRGDVPLDALVLAMGLKPALDLPPATLDPACATLAEALAQPRYDLIRRREAFLKRDAVTDGRQNLLNEKIPEPLPAQKMEIVETVVEERVPETWEIRLGGYREAWRVRNLVSKINELQLPTFTAVVQLAGGERTRLRVGPLLTREDAEQARKRIRAIGLDGPIASSREN